MSRRRRRAGRTKPRCDSCRAEVLFFRDQDDRFRVVNSRPVDGRTESVGAMPEWGGRLWPGVDELAAELSTLRPVGTDTVDEVLDLPWYQLHNCQISAAIAERTREAPHA